MAKQRGTGGMLLPIAIVAVLVVGITWFAITRAIWQFIPIGIFIAMGLTAGRAVNGRKDGG